MKINFYIAVCLVASWPSIIAAQQSPRVYVNGVDSVVAQGIKTFQKLCPAVTLTARQDSADYSVTVADDGSGAGRKGRSAVASTKSGDIVLASSSRSLDSSIKNVCMAIQSDWSKRKP
jgi:hypothetical protein